jgi:hypothetical protein
VRARSSAASSGFEIAAMSPAHAGGDCDEHFQPCIAGSDAHAGQECVNPAASVLNGDDRVRHARDRLWCAWTPNSPALSRLWRWASPCDIVDGHGAAGVDDVDSRSRFPPSDGAARLTAAGRSCGYHQESDAFIPSSRAAAMWSAAVSASVQ